MIVEQNPSVDRQVGGYLHHRIQGASTPRSSVDTYSGTISNNRRAYMAGTEESGVARGTPTDEERIKAKIKRYEDLIRPGVEENNTSLIEQIQSFGDSWIWASAKKDCTYLLTSVKAHVLALIDSKVQVMDSYDHNLSIDVEKDTVTGTYSRGYEKMTLNGSFGHFTWPAKVTCTVEQFEANLDKELNRLT